MPDDESPRHRGEPDPDETGGPDHPVMSWAPTLLAGAVAMALVAVVVLARLGAVDGLVLHGIVVAFAVVLAIVLLLLDGGRLLLAAALVAAPTALTHLAARNAVEPDGLGSAWLFTAGTVTATFVVAYVARAVLRRRGEGRFAHLWFDAIPDALTSWP